MFLTVGGNQQHAMSDITFAAMMFGWIIAVSLASYWRSVPTSAVARVSQNWGWVVSWLLLSILFAVHLPGDLFFFVALNIVAFPLLVFRPVQ